MTVSRIRRLEAEVGALLSRQHSHRDRASFMRFQNQPVAFIHEVLSGSPWSAQVEIAEAVASHSLVAVQSCNGAGKDWLAARLALWWVYAHHGLVLVTGPTDRQVRNVVMGEVRRAFLGSSLPGDLYESALYADNDRQSGILALTSSEVSRLTGFHAPSLMIILTEAQGVSDFAWEGMMACATGEDSKTLAVGNPLFPGGRFFDVCRSARWTSFTLSAFDHPNLVEGREIIPGAVTRQFVERVKDEYGDGSTVYQSRVLGEFPEESESSLVLHRWVREAQANFASGVHEELSRKRSWVAAVDPARMGPDKTALGLRQGLILRSVNCWQHADTMATCGQIIEVLRGQGLDATKINPVCRNMDAFILHNYTSPRHAKIVVDEIGVGSGVLDRLREIGLRVDGFNGSARPSGRNAPQFANARAQAYWNLRRLMEEGKIAIPPDEHLTEELISVRWKVNSAGRVQIEPKEDLRARLRRSPDKADAMAMAFATLDRRERPSSDRLPPMAMS